MNQDVANSMTTPHDYWYVFQRKKWFFILPALLVFMLVGAVALLLPSIYKSEATILIEAQEIPQELVRTTVTGYVEERLHTITQIVLSRRNLQEIIDRFNPYPELQGIATAEDLITKMREDVSMVPIQADVVNPQSGRPGTATVAFLLSYQGRDPVKVTRIANTLASLYLQENMRVREERASTTYDFLESQLDSLNEEILGVEVELAAFKEKNLHSLPELMELNLRNLDRVQRDVLTLREQLKTLRDRKIYLEGQLATIRPYRHVMTSDGTRTLTPEEEMKTLHSRLIALRAAKSDKHPDVISLRKQIGAMEEQVGQQSAYREKTTELQQKRSLLAQLSERYTSKHPDVTRLQMEVVGLEKELEAMADSDFNIIPREGMEVDNPSYITIMTQVEATSLELENTLSLLADQERQYQEYNRRIELTPRVEQEYAVLQRNYQSAKTKHLDTLARLHAAREAKGLEEGNMAERLTVINPPQIPEKPFKPNRLAIMLVAVVLSLGVGAGSGAAAEFLDQSVRSGKELTGLSNKPILSNIPYLETRWDIRKRRFTTISIGIGFVLMLAIGIFIIHIYYRPLDILWLDIQKKFQLILK